MTLQAAAQDFVNDFNETYAQKHKAFEDQFWGTKMALSSTDYSTELLSSTKKEMEDLLSDPEILKKAKQFKEELKDDDDSNDNVMRCLNIIIRTCQCNAFPTPQAKQIREQTNQFEDTLSQKRNEMTTLGYTNDKGEFVQASSVGLRTTMRTASDEAVRKSAYTSLQSIGDFCLKEGFPEIVKLRNKLAKQVGYADYYDYTVTNAEGFGKERLFEILDGLEEGTRPLMVQARQQLQTEKGDSSIEPWNMGYAMAGSVVPKMDPYFPFSKSVENYMRSYAAMKISYCGATMTLDLLDRPKKYSNGFCHWPQCAWVQPNETFVPSQTNFTSLADPTAVGSGLTALNTLMHEAGHAAHFANIRQPSPLFSQERAPTSVAYAENQSMFLDSLVGDAAWRAKYARDVTGKVLPFEIIEEDVRSTHPYKVFALRAMLAVSYFEKALYELPEEQVTCDNILKLAEEIELKIQGGPSSRPLLSVPHIYSDEASCYYQGYTLAEMSVHQTREFFKQRDGHIVDNPKVGPTLTKAYWECGNSRPFLELVQELTGKELSGKAWIDALTTNVEDLVTSEKKEYEEMFQKCAEEKQDDDDDLDDVLQMTVRFVDGDEVIADSKDSGLYGACRKFETFVAGRVAAAKKTTED